MEDYSVVFVFILGSVADFDAILFHARDINLRDLPKSRNPRQFYIMFLNESPQMDAFPIIEFVPFEFPPYKKLKGFFNWTMTYRRDSDFFMPYGWIDPKNWTLPYPLSKPIDWGQHIFTDLKQVNNKKQGRVVGQIHLLIYLIIISGQGFFIIFQCSTVFFSAIQFEK